MGCGASKNDVIKSASSSDILPNPKKDGSNNSAISEASTIPAHDGDMYQNGKGPKVLPPLKPLRNPREKPPEPIAFEVPAGDEDPSSGDGSLIKKHPPRRLRQLEEKSASDEPVLTQEDIEEKVALANQRRNQVLTQRVASARQKSARGGRSRKPVLMDDQYTMAELDNELFGNNNSEGLGFGGGGGIGSDFS